MQIRLSSLPRTVGFRLTSVFTGRMIARVRLPETRTEGQGRGRRRCMAFRGNMKQNNTLMTEGNIRRKMLGFALPILAGYFFQQLYNTVDALIVGNYLDADALAAVTSTGSYTYLMIAFVSGFATGAGIIIARHIGANHPDDTEKAVHTAVALGGLFSILMTVFGILITPPILRLMGTPDTVFDRSCRYLQVYFSGAAALVLYNMFVSILQASGESRFPLLCLVASSLTNIVLDILFIAVFHMDVEGAALATVLSEVLSMVLVGGKLLRRRDSIRVQPRRIRMDHESLRYIIRYGFPTAMQGCVIDLSNMLIQSYINSFGRNAMAGIGSSTKLEGFMFLPVTAFSMALTTFVSQNRGAGKQDRVQAGAKFGLFCTFVILLVFGTVSFFLAPQMITLFNADPEIVRYGAGRTTICAFFYCLCGFSHTASALMRGMGKPVTPMVVMLVCWCAVRVLVLFTLGRFLHEIWLIYWIYPFTWSLSSIVYLLEFRKMHLFSRNQATPADAA